MSIRGGHSRCFGLVATGQGDIAIQSAAAVVLQCSLSNLHHDQHMNCVRD